MHFPIDLMRAARARARRTTALLLVATATPLLAQSELTARVDQLLLDVRREAGLPSLSVAIARDGEVLYAAAQGAADLENEVPATRATVYSLGSVTKAFTAVAALRLAEEGRVDLDAPARSYCPAFPDKPKQPTVGQLLAHTGGIRHYDYRRFEEDFLNRRRFESTAAALVKFADDPLRAEPGAQYHYSSWGYVLLGCALEGAAGVPYDVLLRETVLEPAGLASVRLDAVRDLVPHRARGYSRSEEGDIVNAGLFDPSDRYPAGGLLGTPTDLARFASALLDGKLLCQETRQRMWSSAATTAGEPTGHGFGWALSPEAGAVHQGGTSVGASTYLYVLPAERIAVALATNLSLWTEGRHELAARLAEIAATDVGGTSRAEPTP
jgi:CubicO group peptidase (beta-lactamase class C family)